MALVVDRADLLVDRICRACGKWRDLFAAIGVSVTAYWALRLSQKSLSSIWSHLGGMINVRRRLARYGRKVVVIGSSSAVRNEILKRLAADRFEIILVQDKPVNQDISTYFEYEYTLPIVVRNSEDIRTESGARSFTELLEKSDVGVLIDTTCCLDASVPILDPSHADFRHLRQWFDSHLWMRMAVLFTKLYLAKRKQALVATVVYSCSDENEALGTNVLLHWLSRTLTVSCGSGLQEQYFFPWKLNCPSVQRDIFERGSSQASANGGLLSFLARFWVPLPKTYARHLMWSLGQPGVGTGYLPHSFILWLSRFFKCDFSRHCSQRPAPVTAADDPRDVLLEGTY